jgi:hypothetical protein
MQTAALLVGLLSAAAIIVLGTRFFLTPRQATLEFGVAPDNVRALAAIKGGRDVTLGAIVLLVWAGAGQTAVGWALLGASVAPMFDAAIVMTNGGKVAKALGVHGITAVLLVAAGLILALG